MNFQTHEVTIERKLKSSELEKYPKLNLTLTSETHEVTIEIKISQSKLESSTELSNT
jgi:hypothetical protein